MSLSRKIVLLALLNVSLLAAILVGFLAFQAGAGPESVLLGPAQDRVIGVAHRVGLDLSVSDRPAAVLAYHSRLLHADLFLTDLRGQPLTGRRVTVPQEILQAAERPPGRRKKLDRKSKKGPGRRPPPVVMTFNAEGYWAGIRMPVPDELLPGGEDALFVVRSASLLNSELFFDWRPLVAVTVCGVLVSILCWLPFVRGLTRSISQLTRATEEIAAGRFDAPMPAVRSDELGVLGASVSELAARLAGFVRGQKRFLGDIAHELSAPIARVQFALGILEQNSTHHQQRHVTVLREELEEMSSLVGELASFSKAGLQPADTPLAPVHLAGMVERVVAREAGAAAVTVEVDPQLSVIAHEGLLQRALANLLRNAVRYAGESPIVISAVRDSQSIALTVADGGPGVPAEAMGQLFEPFYRPELSRTRATGGAGLGLAIVKSCVEACRGRVSCRNRLPHGLEVTIELPAAD